MGVKKVHLKFVGISQSTLRSYSKRVKAFLSYLLRESSSFPSSPGVLDSILAEYINNSFQDDDPIAYSGHLISGLTKFIPRLRSCLPTSRAYFRNWQRVQNRSRAVPVAWDVLRAMAASAFLCGQKGLGISLLLGFLLFLRTNELVSLKWSDIKVFENSSAVIVALEDTKTSQAKNALESLIIRDFTLARLIQRESCFHAPDSAVCGLLPSEFRKAFASIAAWIGQPDLSPYSLRRGGATHHWLCFNSLDSTAVRGRWKDVRTCRIYLDDARGQLARQSLSPTTKEKVAKLKGFWNFLVTKP